MTRAQRFFSTRLRGDAGEVATGYKGISMATEPVAIVNAINAAITSTLGILTITEVLSNEVAGAIGAALGAWIIVGNLLFVRSNVSAPNTVEGLTAALAEAEAAKASKVAKTTKPGE